MLFTGNEKFYGRTIFIQYLDDLFNGFVQLMNVLFIINSL